MFRYLTTVKNKLLYLVKMHSGLRSISISSCLFGQKQMFPDAENCTVHWNKHLKFICAIAHDTGLQPGSINAGDVLMCRQADAVTGQQMLG